MMLWYEENILMIPFSIPIAKDQPDLLQKIHSSTATSKIITSPSWRIASEETLQICYVKVRTIFHWNLTLFT